MGKTYAWPFGVNQEIIQHVVTAEDFPPHAEGWVNSKGLFLRSLPFMVRIALYFLFLTGFWVCPWGKA